MIKNHACVSRIIHQSPIPLVRQYVGTSLRMIIVDSSERERLKREQVVKVIRVRRPETKVRTYLCTCIYFFTIIMVFFVKGSHLPMSISSTIVEERFFFHIVNN